MGWGRVNKLVDNMDSFEDTLAFQHGRRFGIEIELNSFDGRGF